MNKAEMICMLTNKLPVGIGNILTPVQQKQLAQQFFELVTQHNIDVIYELYPDYEPTANEIIKELEK